MRRNVDWDVDGTKGINFGEMGSDVVVGVGAEIVEMSAIVVALAGERVVCGVGMMAKIDEVAI